MRKIKNWPQGSAVHIRWQKGRVETVLWLISIPRRLAAECQTSLIGVIQCNSYSLLFACTVPLWPFQMLDRCVPLCLPRWCLLEKTWRGYFFRPSMPPDFFFFNNIQSSLKPSTPSTEMDEIPLQPQSHSHVQCGRPAPFLFIAAFSTTGKLRSNSSHRSIS
jgi:hypothetical protein